MRFGLDARTLTLPRPRGTGRNLLDAYALVPALRPAWEFVLYHQRPLPPPAEGTLWRRPNVRPRQIDLPGDRLGAWFHLRLPLAAAYDRIELLHLPANAAPAWCPVPFVVTIHDLAPLEIPGELPPRQTAAFERGVRRALRRAVHLITPSAATRDALQARYRVDPARVTVVPWAADARIAEEARLGLGERRRALLRARHDLAEHWLLCFAGDSVRKNAAGAIEGFARLPADLRPGLQLVLVGVSKPHPRAALAECAARCGIADACRILDFVPHEDLPALLRGACGLLMPSLCEGFGLPLLDAFTCGVPVLTSNCSAMPEVGGDAALYCDPRDPAGIAAGLRDLLSPATAARLVARGYERIEHYTWQRTAAALCEVYEHAARTARRRPAALAGGVA